MQLRIEQQNAVLGLSFRLPTMKIDRVPGSFLLESKDAKLKIKFDYPKIDIDYTRCWEDMGIRSPKAMVDYFAGQAEDHVLNEIGQTVKEGDRLSEPQKGYTLADLARDESFNIREYNIAVVPKQPPEINFETSDVEVKATPSELKVKSNMELLRIRSRWENIRAFYLVEPEIRVYLQGDLEMVG
ncbi:MAG: DUF6470 family protein [Chitinophagales bacterium]